MGGRNQAYGHGVAVFTGCFSAEDPMAVASVPQVDWAAAYFASALSRGLRKNHAYRCVANRWLGIIWKMRQTHRPYDETYHLKQIHHQRRPT
jgi:hypothetical protein